VTDGTAIPPSPPPRAAWRALPAGIWAMGFGSMFMDISSEMTHSVLPMFMANVLGTSMVAIGIVEGVAEASAAITKVFSGAISDRLRQRKLPMILGYALSAVTKPVFPLANAIGWVFTARFADRVGKGMRGSPRDALLAEIAPPGLRGAAFGLRQGLDSLGALLGPLLAFGLLAWFADDIAAVMWVAVVPAFIAVAILVRYVREPRRAAGTAVATRGPSLVAIGRLPARYWRVVLLGAVFALARFSEAFLVLRAQDVGLSLASVPLIMVVMNAAYTGLAYPAGAAADRVSAKSLLLAGLALLIAADLVLASAASGGAVFTGAALWGLHLALTQGLLSKLVADTSPPELRGTAFGVFNLASGVALLLASVIAGALWSGAGAPFTFLAGAAFAATAALALLLHRR
jgi:MFS family permease